MTTALTVGAGAEWLAAASNRGFVTLWDLRFQLTVDVWRHPSRDGIHAMVAANGAVAAAPNGGGGGGPAVVVSTSG